MYTVRLKFEQTGLAPVTLENAEPGQSLLELALTNNIDLRHKCGGVCSCTTCHVYIEKGMDYIDEMSNKEKQLIHRVINPRLNSRLGCQSLLLDGDGDIEVLIPEQAQIPGE